MKNKYAYNKTHHFNYILDDNKIINSELRYKLETQFKLFDDEFKKVLLIYDLKNFISYNYLLKELINLNENLEFTKTPILIGANFKQNELIHLTLLNKGILNTFSKVQIHEYLFNITCEKLGWCKLI